MVRDFYDCDFASKNRKPEIPVRTMIEIWAYVKNGSQRIQSFENCLKYGGQPVGHPLDDFVLNMEPLVVRDNIRLRYDLHGIDANDIDINLIEWSFKDQYAQWYSLKLNIPEDRTKPGFIPDPYLIARKARLDAEKGAL